MKSRVVPEAVEGKTQDESQRHLGGAAHAEREPKDKKIIDIGRSHVMEVDPVQYKDLDRDQYDKPDDIFYQGTHFGFAAAI
jgi:hypothetical protein